MFWAFISVLVLAFYPVFPDPLHFVVLALLWLLVASIDLWILGQALIAVGDLWDWLSAANH